IVRVMTAALCWSRYACSAQLVRASSVAKTMSLTRSASRSTLRSSQSRTSLRKLTTVGGSADPVYVEAPARGSGPFIRSGLPTFERCYARALECVPSTSTRFTSRGGGIRTHGLFVPNEARYQAAPHPAEQPAQHTCPANLVRTRYERQQRRLRPAAEPDRGVRVGAEPRADVKVHPLVPGV